LGSSDDPRPDDAIRDAQRGGAGRGGAAQHVAGNGADARDRSEHRVWLVVDGFRWKSMTPQTTRQRRHGMVASFSTAPSAAGANTSTCWVWISSGAATVAPQVAAACAQRFASRSLTTNAAPATDK